MAAAPSEWHGRARLGRAAVVIAARAITVRHGPPMGAEGSGRVDQLTSNALGIAIAIGDLRERGIDPAPLLEASGLKANAAYGADVSVPAHAQATFFEHAAAALEDDFLGYGVAMRSDPLVLGPIS